MLLTATLRRLILECKIKVMNIPINAAKASSEPIQAASSIVGTAGNGESTSVVSSSLGLTGDVQPSVVPTAKLDRLALDGQ